ncbi:unnamed protein product [Dracunculus medinensis]|uniref:Uncharacterized protein n=1 Tax=Dracunculus medinensis TaxID=318479 RepID=A0A0N4UDS5_DRAME|nr:unnamed protein product [Dracunculus medinensis]
MQIGRIAEEEVDFEHQPDFTLNFAKNRDPARLLDFSRNRRPYQRLSKINLTKPRLYTDCMKNAGNPKLTWYHPPCCTVESKAERQQLLSLKQ